MNKKIVVTGATGFIGSNLLAELEKRGYEQIVAVDWFGTEGKWKNVAKRSKVYYLAPETLTEYIDEKHDSIDCIIHLGAISSTTETDGDLVVSTNYRLSVDLYEICSRWSISFIYASSAATYGNGEFGYIDNSSVEFLANLRPMNLYGWSKNQTDLYIARDGGFYESGTQIVGLRFFNVYGPNEYHKGTQKSIIEPFMSQLLSNGVIHLFKSNSDDIEDGNQARDFIYINDCIDVIIWFIEHKSISGLFNVGTGTATTYNDVSKYVSEAMKRPCNIEYIDMPDNLRSQYQNYTCADITKLRSIGYSKEMTSIKDGIRDYIQNFLTKQDKYK